LSTVYCDKIYFAAPASRIGIGLFDSCVSAELMVLQEVEKECHFERQREIFLLNKLVLLRFLPLVEMTIGQSGLFGVSPARYLDCHS